MYDIDDIISKYLLGSLSEDESNFLEKWRQQNNNEEIFKYLVGYVNLTQGEKKPDLLFRDFIKIRETVQDTIEEAEVRTKQIPKTKNISYWKNWFLAACVSLLTIGIGYIFFFELNEEQPSQEFANTSINWIEKKTVNGQKLKLTLKDGSKVTLNSGTSLFYPVNFEADSRQVKLLGEAYFEITKDSSRPFEILSGSMKTTVLGTSFNVDAYSGNDKIKVAVVEGKVKIENINKRTEENERELVLTHGEMGTYGIDNGQFDKSDFDAVFVLGWKDKTIVFKNANFPEIINKLEKWYGVEFILHKRVKVSNEGYNGIFKDEPLGNVLESIGYSLDFNYKIEGKQITIE